MFLVKFTEHVVVKVSFFEVVKLRFVVKISEYIFIIVQMVTLFSCFKLLTHLINTLAKSVFRVYMNQSKKMVCMSSLHRNIFFDFIMWGKYTVQFQMNYE